jgi:hypothetical protein
MRQLMLTAVLAVALVGTASGQTRPHGQNFFSNCYFSHISPDDPIVYPRQPGVSQRWHERYERQFSYITASFAGAQQLLPARARAAVSPPG